MDIISQLQEQAESIGSIAFNTFGTLQRDAPPIRLSNNYPIPPSTNNTDIITEHHNNITQTMALSLIKAAKQFLAFNTDIITEHHNNITKTMALSLVKAAKQFDALVAALPLAEGGEEAQLKRIAELQAENDVVGQELQRQLEAAEKELEQVKELFSQATNNCLNLKKPE